MPEEFWYGLLVGFLWLCWNLWYAYRIWMVKRVNPLCLQALPPELERQRGRIDEVDQWDPFGTSAKEGLKPGQGGQGGLLPIRQSSVRKRAPSLHEMLWSPRESPRQSREHSADGAGKAAATEEKKKDK